MQKSLFNQEKIADPRITAQVFFSSSNFLATSVKVEIPPIQRF